MNICFVHEEYPEETNFGGIATYQKNMAEELVRKGNNVYVICRSLTNDSYYIENGVKIYRIFVSKTNNQVRDYIIYRKRVAQILYNLQNNNLIDIIEVPDWGAETVYFEKNRKIPLVVRLHTPLKVWLKYNKNNFGKITVLMLKWEEKMLNSANLITCCSNALKNIIVKDFNIEKDQILVTPNPANISAFYRDESIFKQPKMIFVGSLEERKGVLLLAEALNIVFHKYPNLNIEFIGKDTTRNKKNMSTKELITSIVEEKFRKNIKFVGQIENVKLNEYLNSSKVAIFPSLFDNFPYVVLEAMSVGLYIVGSSNSGMVEMLNNKSCIYDTGNYIDLAEKIMSQYELSLINEVNTKNITRVKEEYNPDKICEEIVYEYKKTIRKYNEDNVTLEDLQAVLNNVVNDKIINYKKIRSGIANLVFKVTTSKAKFIIKKYLYDYNFDLSKELYKRYEINNIKFIKPINNDTITYKSYKYNIFNYINVHKLTKNKLKLFENILCIDRSTNFSQTLLKKCLEYYQYLSKSSETNGINKEDINYVINIFNTLDTSLLNEQYLNHGDISKNNIVYNYIIDFDETCVSSALYDFAVIVIKNFVKNDKLNLKKYNLLKEKTKKYFVEYSDLDYYNITKFYLCKIIMEKFYLHQKGKIDLFSKNQMKDNYKRYLKLLKQLENESEK